MSKVMVRRKSVERVVRSVLDQLEERRMFALTYFPLASGPYNQNWESVDYTGTENTAATWQPVGGGDYSIDGYAIRRSGADVNPDLSQRVDDPQVVVGNTGTTFPFQYATLRVNRTGNHPTGSGISETVPSVSVPNVGTKTMVFLQGDSTANQNYLKLYMNNTGRTAPVSISYDLIDVDDTSNVPTQKFGLQYRIGNTGNFTWVPAGAATVGSTVSGEVGQTTTINATLGDDTIGAAQVEIRIISGNGSGIDQAIAVDNIHVAGANDPGILSIVADTPQVNENGTASFTVSRPTGSVGAVSVNYTYVAGTATAGVDFPVGGGTLSFGANEITKTVQIPLAPYDDSVAEGPETFSVTLSNPTGGASIGNSSKTATFTIIDNDAAAPTGLVINEVVGNPVDDDQGEYVEIRNTTNSPIVLSNVYFVSIEGDGTASGLADVVVDLTGKAIPANGFLVITGTTNTYNITNPNTTVVTAPQFGTSAGILETGTNSFGLFFSPTPFVQGTDLDTALTYDGTLNNLPAGAQILDIIGMNDAVEGTVLATPDRTYGPIVYGFGSTTISDGPDAITRFPTSTTPTTSLTGIGSTSTEFYGGNLIDPNPIDQATTDPNGITYSNINFTANKPNAAVITPGAANYGPATATSQTGNIGIVARYTYDEDTETQTDTNPVKNNGFVVATIYRSGGTAGTQTVQWATSDGFAAGALNEVSAIAGQDYTASSGTVTFAPGETTKTIQIPIINDSVTEGTEGFTITLSNVTGGGTIVPLGTARVDIAPSDAVEPTPGSVLINEFETNPAGNDAPYEYIELKGTPGMSLNGFYLLDIEGSGTGAGTVDILINLADARIGSNGILLIRASGGHAVQDPASGLFIDSSTYESDTTTLMLVYKKPDAILPAEGTDYDPNNDGSLNIDTPDYLVRMDSVSWLDGDADPINIAYSPTVLPPVVDMTGGGGGSTWFGAATRFPDSTAVSPTDWENHWYYGTVTDFGSTPATTNQALLNYSAQPNRNSTNFPAGGILTPGAKNAPSGDTTPPNVSSVTFDRLTQKVTVVFDEDVHSSIAATVFTLTNNTNAANGATLVVSSVSADGKTVVLSFTGTGGLKPTILKDGNYTLTVTTSVKDEAGNALAVAFPKPFFFKNGDFDGDRDVDFDDLLTLAKNYNGTGRTMAQGDTDLDGDVDFDDLLTLAKNYNQSVPPPAAASAAAVAASDTGTSATRKRTSALGTDSVIA